MNFTDTYACRKRAACKDCRSRPDWRAAMGAPEVCPYGEGGEQLPVLKNVNGEVIPYVTAEIPAQCVECPKFKAPDHCGKCGCPSEAKQLRLVKEIKVCPIKKWIRRPSWAVDESPLK